MRSISSELWVLALCSFVFSDYSYRKTQCDSVAALADDHTLASLQLRALPCACREGIWAREPSILPKPVFLWLTVAELHELMPLEVQAQIRCLTMTSFSS